VRAVLPGAGTWGAGTIRASLVVAFCVFETVPPIRTFALIGTLLLACAAAQAQPTYRCQQEGRTVVSDRPCSGGAAAAPAKGDERAAREAAPRRNEQAEREQQGRVSAQCSELKRILANRAERWAALSEGERRDFERGKAIYHERCSAG
jgi:hypothetical protein